MRSLVIAATFAFFAAGAGEAAAADTYAAIAFSKVNGYSGFGNRYPTRAGAEERALQECGESCNVVIWTRDACAVLAVGTGNGYGVFWSTDEDGAVSGALDECNARTADCALRVMTCSAY